MVLLFPHSSSLFVLKLIWGCLDLKTSRQLQFLKTSESFRNWNHFVFHAEPQTHVSWFSAINSQKTWVLILLFYFLFGVEMDTAFLMSLSWPILLVLVSGLNFGTQTQNIPEPSIWMPLPLGVKSHNVHKKIWASVPCLLCSMTCFWRLWEIHHWTQQLLKFYISSI